MEGGSEAPRLNCTLTVAIQGGEAREMRGAAGGGAECGAEEGAGGRGDPDRWAPAGSDRKKKRKRGEGDAGPAARLGGPRRLARLLAKWWAAGGREWEKGGEKGEAGHVGLLGRTG
jgi:hypothetical protein